MGAVFRLTDENERKLKAIDENPHKAIKIVLEGYTAHEDLKKEHKQLSDEIEALKTELKEEITGLKQGY